MLEIASFSTVICKNEKKKFHLIKFLPFPRMFTILTLIFIAFKRTNNMAVCVCMYRSMEAIVGQSTELQARVSSLVLSNGQRMLIKNARRYHSEEREQDLYFFFLFEQCYK